MKVRHTRLVLIIMLIFVIYVVSPPQSLIPVVMSGIIAVYGLVVSVLIAGGREYGL